MASDLQYELGYRCSNYKNDAGEEKARFAKPIQVLKSNKEGGGLFARVCIRTLSPSLVLLLGAAGSSLEDDVLMSVFSRHDDEPADLESKICYICGERPDGNGGKKPVWATLAKVWKSESGKLYGKVDALALNPTVLVQFRKQKGELSRELFFPVFIEKPAAERTPAATPGEKDDDEIPF